MVERTRAQAIYVNQSKPAKLGSKRIPWPASREIRIRLHADRVQETLAKLDAIYRRNKGYEVS